MQALAKRIESDISEPDQGYERCDGQRHTREGITRSRYMHGIPEYISIRKGWRIDWEYKE